MLGREKNVYRVVWGNLKVSNYVENLVDGRIVLKCM
jgi:hypothetical protein